MSPGYAVGPKPFIKWIGGKQRVISQLAPLLPYDLGTEARFRYFEPFLGGGAMLLYVKHFYPRMNCRVGDINPMLTLAWNSVRRDTDYLIQCLSEIKEEYLSMPFGSQEREDFYYAIREEFNEMKDAKFERIDAATEQVALFIFLNFTCFNGLYRENSKGELNAAHGKYPDHQVNIFDEDNIRAVAKLISKARIDTQSYTETVWPMVNPQSFVYFDPPYREVKQATNANKSGVYQKVNSFSTDERQLELAAFANDCADQGAKVMISNSDPQAKDPDDDFFYQAYPSDKWNIQRVSVRRSVNQDTNGRGSVPELVIRNYVE